MCMCVYVYKCIMERTPWAPTHVKCDKPDWVSRHSDRWEEGRGGALIQSAMVRSALFIDNLKHVLHCQLKCPHRPS